MTGLGNKKIMAKNLKYYMELNKKERVDLCKDLGFKYTTVTDWVNGNVYPRIDKIEMMANYFGIQKSDLIEEKAKDKSIINYSIIENLIKKSAPSIDNADELYELLGAFTQMTAEKRKKFLAIARLEIQEQSSKDE